MPGPRRFLALAALLAYVALAPAPLAGVSNSVVISQIYGGGGNAGATFRNDFIELHNRGTSPADLTGWSVQYAAAGGTTWQRTNLTNVVVQPGQYYLVQEAVGAGGTVNLPAPDATGTIAMSATAGKVALISSQTTLTGSGCPFDARVVDFVGFGSTATCFEGPGPTPTLSNTTAALRNANGCTDTDANAADFVVGPPNPRNTAAPAVNCSSTPPSITAATANPTLALQGGTLTFTVVVKPGTNPADTNISVTGDFSSIGATGTFALTGASADTGEQTFTATVGVGGNVTPGPKSIPVTAADGAGRQATSTISMAVRSSTLTLIHDIQGMGSFSPLNGMLLTTRGIVTGRRSNGFFIQDEEANYDADPNTSEGVFVFTSSAPPAAATVGNAVFVIGTVSEFIPSADPLSPPTTELTGPFVAVDAVGGAMPTPVELTAADLNAAGSVEQLERLEGMRVSVATLTVVAPTGGSVTESSATAASSGVFYGVLPGAPRPFREPGIEVFEPVPMEAVNPFGVPRFDANPERIRVDSDAVGGPTLNVTPGATVTGVAGPLDYSFRSYTIDVEPTVPLTVSGVTTTATAVPLAAADEFTVGSANLERFFDTINDPTKDEAVLTQAAFNNRLNKVSLQIRSVMRSPDIIGVEEVENLSTLQAIAAKVNADAAAASEPNPDYVAYLEEGNDIGGIDSGFLVKSSRVTVIDVTQEGLTTPFAFPGSPTLPLNDRPPLILRALVHEIPNDAGLPITVIVNHLRSLSGINDADDGARVRAKRRTQAEFLANLIQARQFANPTERIVSVGDYNAFQFNDGYVDSIGTIKGTPTPLDQVTLASPDLVNPNLVDLVDTAPSDQRYSFVFDGNAQELDHVLITQNLVGLSNGLSYGRNNADFPEVLRNDPNTPLRVSDHDPVVAYFSFPQQTTTTVSANPPTSTFGQPITFTATVTSSGSPVTKGTVAFTDGSLVLAGPIALDGNGRASFTTNALMPGTHTVTAGFSGAGPLQPSTGAVQVVIVPAMSIDDVSVREPDHSIALTTRATFTVTLSAPSPETVSVRFATASLTATAGSDYVSTMGTLTFLPGITSQTIAVDVMADPRREFTETFTLDLNAATNATIADGQGVGSIIDLKEPPLTIRSFAPDRRAAGATINIIGTGFGDAQSVRFNGVPADFTILSSNVIRAIVPAATSGPITVTTSTDSATSGASFIVTQ